MKSMNEHVIEFQYNNKTQHELASSDQRRLSLLV